MPARQYIGARYVTKVYENSQDPGSAEWESGINYEPLTMVTYNMGSYLSKKEVPASVGDPAANTQYWAQTGFYNGQIAALDAKKMDRYSQGPDDWDTTPTASSDKAVTSDGIKTALDLKAGKADIAYVESGTTASENRSVGDFVYVNGTLYKVTSSISAGATYTVGTNIIVDTVCAELTNINNMGVKHIITASNETRILELLRGTDTRLLVGSINSGNDGIASYYSIWYQGIPAGDRPSDNVRFKAIGNDGNDYPIQILASNGGVQTLSAIPANIMLTVCTAWGVA